LDDILIYRIVVIFMIGLISFYLVLFILLVDFWPKFACLLETIE